MLLGAALTRHHRSLIFRREATQATGLIDRLTEILGTRNGLNRQEGTWHVPNSTNDQIIRIGSCPNPGDEMRHQGKPYDLMGFDEAVHFLPTQVKFLKTWNRTTRVGQRRRLILTSNPPTPTNQRSDTNGRWLVEMFAPWLDPNHPNPAQPGELRWYLTTSAGERWLTEQADIEQAELRIPFDTGEPDPVEARSRTFIPAKVQDNPHLMRTGYLSQLQSLPEPLRSQMLYGDFSAALGDNAAQLIPTRWVADAMQRYRDLDASGALAALRRAPMTGIGVDAVRGGRDNMVISTRHGWLLDKLHAIPGAMVTNGPEAAGHVVAKIRDNPDIAIDVIGIGASVFDHLATTGYNVFPFAGSEKAQSTDRSGRLTFVNKRTEAYWRLRDYLDPSTPGEPILPPSESLLADLTTPCFEQTSTGIKMTPKKDVILALGRSPDEGDSVAMNFYYADDLEEAQAMAKLPPLGRSESRAKTSKIGWNTPLTYDTRWIV